jgi:hypothetical protein
MHTSPFAWAVGQPGTERWLKTELQGLRPDLRPGFQRPGRVTFKATGRPFAPDEAPEAIFARAWACSAGNVPDAAGVLAVADRVGATHLWLDAADAGVPEEVPPARARAFAEDAAQWRATLETLAPGRFSGEPPPRAP